MNKAIMIAIQPKWLKQIINGEKEFEFRNYPIAKGTKVYLYESKGKFKQGITPVSETNPMPRYWCEYEGKGAVVAEFVVDECSKYYEEYPNSPYERANVSFNAIDLQCGVETYDKEWLINQGYTNQKYAIKIKDLIVYDEAIAVTEFVSWNKLEEYVCVKTRGGVLGKIEYKLHPLTLDKFKLTHAPQSRVYVVEKEWE